jgi:hypothetical protein
MGGVLSGAVLSRVNRAFALAPPPCFLRNTHILTAQGERPVEDLSIGDLVMTVGGQAKPIEWIGRRRHTRAAGEKWATDIVPVRIARGALAEDLPHADLFLSQKHCLLIDGRLIRAGDLVNGMSISFASREDLMEIEYLHIRLSGHDAIFAEGVATETLLFDASSRKSLDNLEEYARLYGTVDIAERPYAPVYALSDQGRLWSHLRSATSPWLDRRNAFDRARDALWERAEALAG